MRHHKPLINQRQKKCAKLLNFAHRSSDDGSGQQLRNRNWLQFASGCVAASMSPAALFSMLPAVNNGWAFAAFLILVALYLWHRDGP
jgi:hypothetical protein